VNPDEKTENDLAPESDEQEGTQDEPVVVEMEQAEEGQSADLRESDEQEGTPDEPAVVVLEQAEEEQPDDLPEAEERDGSDEESVPEPEREKRAGRPQADASKLKPILEALIFVSEQPISLDKMAGVLPDCPKKKLKELLAELGQDYEERGAALEIVEVANGYQFRTRVEFAPWLGKLQQQKFARLSRAALETLAIVAYRQPVTRAEAESIRGVDSGAVLGTLLERGLLRILGRKEVPGRPILYGTTHEFLELFGLKNLKDLPTLREIKDMVETAEEGPGSPEEGSAEGMEGAQGEEAVEEDGASGEEGPAEADDEASPASGEDEGDEDEYEDDDEDESDSDDEGEWSEDEEPLGDEEITPGELDEILQSTKTRLELYEADVEEEEETGQTEPAEGEEATKKAGDNPDEG
jgi:segregation and condensation protein B